MARSATTEGDREEGTAGAPEQPVPATAAREEQLVLSRMMQQMLAESVAPVMAKVSGGREA